MAAGGSLDLFDQEDSNMMLFLASGITLIIYSAVAAVWGLFKLILTVIFALLLKGRFGSGRALAEFSAYSQKEIWIKGTGSRYFRYDLADNADLRSQHIDLQRFVSDYLNNSGRDY